MRLTRHDLEAVAEHVTAVEEAGVRVSALTVNGLLVTLSHTEHQFDIYGNRNTVFSRRRNYNILSLWQIRIFRQLPIPGNAFIRQRVLYILHAVCGIALDRFYLHGVSVCILYDFIDKSCVIASAVLFPLKENDVSRLRYVITIPVVLHRAELICPPAAVSLNRHKIGIYTRIVKAKRYEHGAPVAV